jgi:hypothetical protein
MEEKANDLAATPRAEREVALHSQGECGSHITPSARHAVLSVFSLSLAVIVPRDGNFLISAAGMWKIAPRGYSTGDQCHE